jgi:serine-threonine kinase receptor-associated protein
VSLTLCLALISRELSGLPNSAMTLEKLSLPAPISQCTPLLLYHKLYSNDRKLWDTYTGEALQTLAHEHIVRSVDISTSQNLIATGGHEKRLRIFDVHNGCKSTDIGRHESTIKSVVWDKTDPSDNTIITSGDDKTVIWWDVRSAAPAAEFKTEDMITSMEQGVDRGVITVTGGKSLHVFDSVR